MADRTIRSVLRAETAAYQRDMAAAAKATEAVGDAGVKASQKGQNAFAILSASARANEQAWSEVGQTLTGIGAVMSGMGATVLAVGINYNTLQQQSRAALTTLTGSAEAANAQMDKLDAFARNSPFAKQTFIQAQQQMLGFGIEASKVIPYLDAIQNAVAAFGGSNQQISDIAFIMSQISAAGKITATDLMQLGQRGVDAATLIGSRMGMTGAEIREAITAGTLDAGQALDALAGGMADRFDGAADNVKDTMVGAFDRVKAAFRDLASEMAEPLVGKEGGGFLIDAANTSADFLRAVQALPAPVKMAGGAVFGLTAAVTLAGGAFMTLAPRIQSSVASAKELAPAAAAAGKAMLTWQNAGRAAVAIAGVALATTDLTDNLEYANTLNGAMMGMIAGPWGAAMGAASGWVMDYANAQKSAERDTSGLTASLDRQTGALTDNSRAWIATSLGSAREQFEALGISASDVTTAIAEGGPALEAMIARIESLRTGDPIGDLGVANLSFLVRTLSGDVTEAQDEFLGIDAAAKEAGAGVSSGMQMGMDAVAGFTQALRDNVDAMRAQRAEALRAMDADLNYAQSLLDARNAMKSVEEGGKGLAGSLRGVRNASEATTQRQIDGMKVLQDLRSSWDGLSDEAQRAPGALKSARRAFLDTAADMEMPRKAARRLADEIYQIPEKRATKVSLEGEQAVLGAATAIGIALDRATRDRTVRIGVSGPGVGAGSIGQPNADGGTIGRYDIGGTVAGQRDPYGDKVLAYLAPGEEVISNRYGQADRHRDLLKAINGNRFADGTNGALAASAGVTTSGMNIARELRFVGMGLKELRKELKASTKTWEGIKGERDAVRSARDSLASAIQGNYRTGMFQQPQNAWAAGASLNPMATLRSDLANLQSLDKARRQLSKKGVKGSALDALLQEGSLSDVQALAGMSKRELRQYSNLYGQREQLLGNVSTAAGNAAYGAELKTLNKEVRGLRQDNKRLEKAVKEAGKKNSKDTSKGVAKATSAARRGESARAGRNAR